MGNPIPGTTAQYGAIGAFVSTEQIYTITPSGPIPIGGSARDSIIANIVFNQSAGHLPPVACITPCLLGDYVFLSYMLFIPTGPTSTKIFVYSFEENNWTVWTLPTTLVQYPPNYCKFPHINGTAALMVPVQNSSATRYIGAFLSNQFGGDAMATYTFRAEIIKPYTQPTTRCVWMTLRDSFNGSATITAAIQATNDNGAVVQAQQSQTVIGTGSGTLMTLRFDVSVTGFRPQLTIFHNTGTGMDITEVVMTGEVEDVVLQ
jgi:hypothetical protein